MTKSTATNIHWNYYIAFERDVETVARYIELNRANYNTYSIELARLFLSASSEVDVLLRELCRLLAPEVNAGGINTYRRVLNEKMRSVATQVIVSDRYGLRLEPWKPWVQDETPEWWDGYNKVKHERVKYFELANLGNVLSAVAGLLSVNLHYVLQALQAAHPTYPYNFRHVISELRPTSELFRLEDSWIYYSE